jgi:hypothetical protein
MGSRPVTGQGRWYDSISAPQLAAFMEDAAQLGLTVGRFSYITAKYLRQPRR